MNTTWYFLPVPLMRFAKRFSDTVRYIDDLLTLNNNSFEEEIINIYPPELTLKRTTESNSRISYLDITYIITSVHDCRLKKNPILYFMPILTLLFVRLCVYLIY